MTTTNRPCYNLWLSFLPEQDLMTICIDERSCYVFDTLAQREAASRLRQQSPLQRAHKDLKFFQDMLKEPGLSEQDKSAVRLNIAAQLTRIANLGG